MRKTITDIQKTQNGTPLVCLTAYTAPIAKILDRECDLLLVGDSLGMVVYGMENTLGVTLDMMMAHGKAVVSASENACIVVDMPFGTYEESPEQAFRNATSIMRETGCQAVKLEGGADMAPTIEYLTKRNIPVMAHIGLMPQSVVKEGGYKVKGKTKDSEAQVIADARAVEAASAFSVVIEGTVEDVSAAITEAISIPTIGIGAGVNCDGQILVTDDLLGLLDGHTPKFVKQYADLKGDVASAIGAYASDVRSRAFPTAEHIYTRPAVVENKKSA